MTQGNVVVIGGGIAGIQCALDMAAAGSKVTLVERSPALGGRMAALDKNFPTLDCSICIEAPRISEAVQDRNIEVLTLAEVKELSGGPGDFTLTIEQQARYVTDACTRCGLCSEACPQVRGNEFDVGLGVRKAIYTPFQQAEPGAFAIDLDSCLNDPPNYLPCNRCVTACGPKCIDFGQAPKKTITRKADAVVVATGFDMFDARQIPEYGYGTNPDVLTAMEFERLLNAAGPTRGEIVRPSDGKHPHKLLFVLCVGSRDERFCHYCSRVCCMYSIKEAVQAHDHGVDEVTVLYMDLRAYGKGFDGFLDRARNEGVRFIRGRPARVDGRPDGTLHVRYEDTAAGGVRDETFDMVVLAPAMLPSAGTPTLATGLGIALGDDGFFAAPADATNLDRTTRPGVYVAGCASGPKDIPDSVAEAGSAAASALGHVRGRAWPQPPDVPPLDTSGEAKVGVFVCDCGSNIAGTIDVPGVVARMGGEAGVAHSEEVMFACANATQQHISDLVREKGLNRVVVAACSPKTHGPTFKGAAQRAGLNPHLVEMANLRNHGSWVHKEDPAGATNKADDLVKMAVEKARRLKPLEAREVTVTPRALVIGGGAAGMTAASALARQGHETHLVERERVLGGRLAKLHHVAGMDQDAKSLSWRLQQEVAKSGVAVHVGTKVEEIAGHVGSFHARLSDGATLDFGAVVIATGADPVGRASFGHAGDKRVITNLELPSRIAQDGVKSVTLLGCVGSRADGRGCSRYCCQSMIHDAITLRRSGRDVSVVSKDMRTYSRHAEEEYAEAARLGVRFYRAPGTGAIEKAVQWSGGALNLQDDLSGTPVSIPSDLLVLVEGLAATGHEDVAGQLKLSIGEDGFLLESHPKLGPVEAAVQGVFLAGSCQGPKDMGESIAQGAAAAAKASALLARPEMEREPLTAQIDAEKCTGCTMCGRVCPFKAIVAEPKQVARVIEAACQGCGTCAATCPSNAITMPGFTDEQILAQIDAATAGHPEDKVVVFACNWCSYAGADNAGIAKIQYPSSSRIIRTMCSGRVSEKFVMHALDRGAGAVLVSGCHPGDCHYLTANLETEKRVNMWKKRIEKRGGDPSKLHLGWFSAAEGNAFAKKMRELDASLGDGAAKRKEVAA